MYVWMFLVSNIMAAFHPDLKAKGGGIEKTSTSKGLIHSNDRIKENWAGEHPPTLLWGNH